MRRPAFKRWIARRLQSLSGGGSLGLRRLAALAQAGQPRLVEPLLLYASEAGKVDALMGFVWKDGVRASYEAALSALEGEGSLQDLALGDLESSALPREYKKHLASYRAAYFRPEADAESKRLRWERSRELQLEKGVPTARICRDLGLNPGNVNAYLKHGALEKVSLRNATAIMGYLASQER